MNDRPIEKSEKLEAPAAVTSPRLGASLILLALILAILLRVEGLERRPMHTDEAVQAYKTGELLETGFYRYNPREYHGPTLYYLSLPLLWLRGVDSFAESSESDYRWLPVLAGLAMILLTLAAANALGWAGAMMTAFLLMASPAMTYYGRYYIQEMLLVLLMAASLLALWHFLKLSRRRWASCLGLGVGLMLATKETSVLILMAVAGAAAFVWALERRAERAEARLPHLLGGQFLWRTGWAIGLAVFISLLFHTSFLTHPGGALDWFRSYLLFSEKGAGATQALHLHPWYRYLEWLFFFRWEGGVFSSEGFIGLAALLGAVVALGRPTLDPEQRRLGRFLTFLALLLILVYSLIPYKTPWNVLPMLTAMILLAGWVLGLWLDSRILRPLRPALPIILILGFFWMGQQNNLFNTRFEADPRNPWVYAHTLPDAARLGERVEAVAAAHPEGRAMPVMVAADSYWPLPWYLRRMQNVGFWNTLPPPGQASRFPVVIASPAIIDAMPGLSLADRVESFYGLRPEVFLVLSVRQELWDRWLDQVQARAEP